MEVQPLADRFAEAMMTHTYSDSLVPLPCS